MDISDCSYHAGGPHGGCCIEGFGLRWWLEEVVQGEAQGKQNVHWIFPGSFPVFSLEVFTAATVSLEPFLPSALYSQQPLGDHSCLFW